jgi:hypothetical protein
MERVRTYLNNLGDVCLIQHVRLQELSDHRLFDHQVLFRIQSQRTAQVSLLV